MDLVNRYIYAVTKGLPQKQRGDIEKELKTLIEDMLEQYEGNEPYEAKAEKVLMSLGDPSVLGENYRESKRYLIGLQNFDNYLLLLKIVLGSVFLGVSIAVGVGSIFSDQQNAAGIFTDYLATLFSAILQGFAWVTVIFAVAEYKGVNLTANGVKKETAWSISELPVIPEKKVVISPVESIFSILITTLFMIILYISPQIFAVYISGDISGKVVIPIFDIVVLKGYRWLLAGILILGITKEVVKLISGRWTLKTSVTYSILSVASTVIALILFSDSHIWNQSFSAELLKYMDFNIGFINNLGYTNAGIIIIIAASGILDVGTALYKGIKYNIIK